MKNFKKYSFLMFLCYFLVNCFSFSAFADIKGGKLELNNATVKVGEKINISINLSDNPGFISANLYVKYDESVLKLQKVSDGNIINGAAHSDSYTSPYGLCWMNDLATENITVNGVLATLTFEVKKTSKTETSITIEQDIVDYKLDSVIFEVSGGRIKLSNEKTSKQKSQSETRDTSLDSSQNDKDNSLAKENSQNRSEADYGATNTTDAQNVATLNQREIDSNSSNSKSDISESHEANTQNNQIDNQSKSSYQYTKQSTEDTIYANEISNNGFPLWIIILIISFAIIGVTVFIILRIISNNRK